MENKKVAAVVFGERDDFQKLKSVANGIAERSQNKSQKDWHGSVNTVSSLSMVKSKIADMNVFGSL